MQQQTPFPPRGEVLAYRPAGLQVVAQAVHLVEEEVDVGVGDGRRGDDVAEEVGPVVQRLVAHHQRAGLHHAALEHRADLQAVRVSALARAHCDPYF